jgi:hypothetical protein
MTRSPIVLVHTAKQLDTHQLWMTPHMSCLAVTGQMIVEAARHF